VIFNDAFAARVKGAILADLSHAQEIIYAEWCRRPKMTQLVENFFNLFHPIA